jgi:hypothetical protein
LTPRRRITFWLYGGLIGILAALLAAMAVATGLTLVAGADQAVRRGLSMLSLVSVAKAFALLAVYTTYFALFIVPFSALAVPVCYRLAVRVAAGTGWEARLLFVTLAVIFGTAGPYLVENAAWTVYKMANPGAFGVPTMWPVFTTFGLFAAPVAALAIWPLMRRVDAKCSVIPVSSPETYTTEMT